MRFVSRLLAGQSLPEKKKKKKKLTTNKAKRTIRVLRPPLVVRPALKHDVEKDEQPGGGQHAERDVADDLHARPRAGDALVQHHQRGLDGPQRRDVERRPGHDHLHDVGKVVKARPARVREPLRPHVVLDRQVPDQAQHRQHDEPVVRPEVLDPPEPDRDARHHEADRRVCAYVPSNLYYFPKKKKKKQGQDKRESGSKVAFFLSFGGGPPEGTVRAGGV